MKIWPSRQMTKLVGRKKNDQRLLEEIEEQRMKR